MSNNARMIQQLQQSLGYWTQIAKLLTYKAGTSPVHITQADIDAYEKAWPDGQLTVDAVPHESLTVRLVTKAECDRIDALRAALKPRRIG